MLRRQLRLRRTCRATVHSNPKGLESKTCPIVAARYPFDPSLCSVKSDRVFEVPFRSISDFSAQRGTATLSHLAKPPGALSFAVGAMVRFPSDCDLLIQSRTPRTTSSPPAASILVALRAAQKRPKEALAKIRWRWPADENRGSPASKTKRPRPAERKLTRTT
jgi:hypothetical protein